MKLEYTLIPHTTESWVLLLPTTAGWTLPCFSLSTRHNWQVVSPIVTAVQSELGINATVLRCVFVNSGSQKQTARVYILENHTPRWTILPGGRWCGRAQLPELELAVPEHREIMETWFAETAGADSSLLRRPWARMGWFTQVTAWIEAQLNRLGLTATAPVKQLRTWERSCILQASTTVGDLYFKAVPTLFAHEVWLMEVLAKSYPSRVPRILAIDAKRHWVLMQDFGGKPLSQVSDITRWQLALRQFAQVQIDSVKELHRWLDWGCPDRRLHRLAAQIDPLLAALPEMPDVSPAETRQLESLAPRLKAMCAELACYRVPHTLEHGDFHAQNIILTDEGTVYFDWSDSAIAHPFFSLSLFFRSIKQEGWFPNLSRVRSRLKTAYLESWTVYEPMDRLLAAFELAQILEVLHHAITYQQILLPTIEDKSKWAAIAPFHLKTLLRHPALVKD